MYGNNSSKLAGWDWNVASVFHTHKLSTFFWTQQKVEWCRNYLLKLIASISLPRFLVENS